MMVYRFSSIPAYLRLVVFPALIIVGTIMFLGAFNKVVVERRLEELSYLLEAASENQDKNKSLEMLAKYARLQARASGQRKENQAKDALEEAKLQIITAITNVDSSAPRTVGVMGALADGAIISLRYLMGKPTIIMLRNAEENKNMYLGYIEERSRRYEKAVLHYLAVIDDATTLKTDRHFALLHAGYCYSFINQPEKAAEYYTYVIKETGSMSEIAHVATKLLVWIKEVQEKNREIKAERSLLARGQKYFKYMDYKKAIVTFNAVIKRIPRKRNQATYYRGQAYEESGNTHLAIADYEHVIAKAPKSTWAKFSNRRLYAINKFYQKDENAAKQAENRMHIMKDKSMLGAISELQKVIKASSLESDASFKLREGRVGLTPDEYLRRGTELYNSRRYTDALSSFQKAIEKKKDYAEAYSNMGLAYKKLKNYPQAEGAFRKAIAINPALDAAKVNLINLLRIMGKDIEHESISTGVRKEHKKVAQGKSESRSALELNAIGISYLDKRKYDDAINCFRKALKQDSNKPGIQVNLGLAYYRKGSYKSAVKYFRQAGTNLGYAGRDKANFNLGLAYQQNKQFTKAVQAYKDVMLLDSTNKEAKENIVSCYLNMASHYNSTRNYKGMINACRNILRYKPDAPAAKRNLANAYITYGVSLMGSGKYEASTVQFGEALKIDPASSLAKENIKIAGENAANKLYNSAVELYSAGKTKQALKMFRKVITLSPGSKAATMAKDNMKIIQGGK